MNNNYQLLLKKSTNAGYSFSDPETIVEWPVPSVVSGSGHILYYKSNFGLCLLWNNLDYSNPVTYFIRSINEGFTFDSTIVVNYNRLGSNSMVISDSGEVYVVSTNANTNHLVLNKANLDPITSVEEDYSIINFYELYQNYPNPFNPVTTIKYQIPKSGIVSLKVYNILGKEIKTLVNDEKTKGRYEIRFDASNLASGVYIYRIQVNDYVSVKKMILVK
jgi:hypothetical protein